MIGAPDAEAVGAGEIEIVDDVTAVIVAPAVIPGADIGEPTSDVGSWVRSCEIPVMIALPLTITPEIETLIAARSLAYVVRLTAEPFAQR